MNLEYNMVSERTKKTTYCVGLLIRSVQRRQTHIWT